MRFLTYYRIEAGSTLHLEPRLRKGFYIFVNTLSSSTITIYTSASDPLKDIKAQIKRNKGLNLDGLGFVFKGVYLKDELTLEDYHIQCEDTLDLVPNAFYDIVLKNKAGDIAKVTVQKMHSVTDVKKMIAEVNFRYSENEDDEPFLIHAGVMLQDSLTMEHYQVTGNFTIDVV